MSNTYAVGPGATNLTNMLAGANIGTPPAAAGFQHGTCEPGMQHGAAAQSSQSWQQPASTWYSPAAPGAQVQKMQRSASDRISPRGASDGTPAVPSLRAHSASRHHTNSASTTPRSSSSGHSSRASHHLGKNPASGYPGVPLTPAQTLVRYGGVSALTEYEQGEVLGFPHVYYVGSGANKHHARPSHRALLESLAVPINTFLLSFLLRPGCPGWNRTSTDFCPKCSGHELRL